MANILTSGTCAKMDLYKKIRDSMIAAGWENVSSLPSTDYDILYSTGNSGDKNLYIQMRPLNYVNGNSIETTDFSHMSIRLLDTYTPGAAGVSGTIPRSANAWLDVALINEAYTLQGVPKETMMNYRIFADKNKIIMVIWPPSSTGYSPIVFFLGLSDIVYAAEPDSRGVIYAHSYSAPAINNLYAANTPGGVGSTNAPEQLPTLAQLAPKNPNVGGAYCISEIYYGNSTEGTRGKIDGIYAMTNQNIVNGDIVTIGTSKYMVFITAGGITSFQSLALLVQIA